MTRFALLLLAAVTAAIVPSTPRRLAHATVLEELSLYQLATRADAIVLARVRRSGSRSTNVRGRLAPVTVSVLEVRVWLKGSGSSEVTVIDL
ncbi:MAG: hypothetical protein H5U40_17855, partial [Polyangiaceae bacterium]|nr:hypothetical protein [Polyangiaceae bacterium]